MPSEITVQKPVAAEQGADALELALIVVSAKATEARATVATIDIAANNSNLLTALPSIHFPTTGKGLQDAHPHEWRRATFHCRATSLLRQPQRP